MTYGDLVALFPEGQGLVALAYVLDTGPALARTRLKDRPTPADRAEMERIADLVSQGLPLQYAIGRWNFYGRDFKVDPRALIPRPETELLVDRALEACPHAIKVLDLCAGSGVIGLTFALERPKARVDLADISPEALDLVRENAKLFALEDRVRIFQGDLFEALPPGETWDLIITNPPYIASREIQTLDALLRHEPENALDGGEDGLDFYRRIGAQAGQKLSEYGMIFTEIGADQGPAVRALFEEAGLALVRVMRDFTDRDRMVSARAGGRHV